MDEAGPGRGNGGNFHAASAAGRARYGILCEERWGWADAVCLRNAIAEAVVVPSIGRLMQFQFLSQPGPLWINPVLQGRRVEENDRGWWNFGGDKSWPAPQSEWPGGTWPPPAAFDARPMRAALLGNGLELTSEVDEPYGLRMTRRFELAAAEAVLRVTTRYEKVTRPAVRASVWVITQLHEGEGIFLEVPEPSRFPGGATALEPYALPESALSGRLLHVRRDPAISSKLGSDASRLLWVGETQMLRIEAEARQAAEEYPDGGCSSQVYLNADPEGYVELETLGPLRRLEAGEWMETAQRYTLLHRQHPDLEMDARRALAG